MDKNMLLKALSWIGLTLVLFTMFVDSNPSVYIIEGLGFAYALAYAYKYATNKLLLVIMTIVFLLNYSFVNVSWLDFIVWTGIGFTLFEKK